MKVRINKFLADHGIASRRAIDEMISRGRIGLNGTVLAHFGEKVDSSDIITIDGKKIKITQKKNNIILFNKPENCITTSADTHGRTTVLDYIKTDTRMFPVGRLDRNTTGVLLVTNDGDLANALMHPRHVVEKVYRAHLDKPFLERDRKVFEDGVIIDKKKTAPSQARINKDDRRDIIVTIHEGRNRQIHRMFNLLGYSVETLDRILYAGLGVDHLKRGEWRYLTKKEIDQLKKLSM